MNIKILHLLSKPNTEREQRSQESIQQLNSFDGFKYVKIINPIHTSLPPKENCLRPDEVQMEPGYYKLTPAHYGNYLSHKDAILNYWDTDTDAVLIFECDAVINTDLNNFVQKIKQAYEINKQEDLLIWTFGPNYGFNETVKEDYIIISRFVECHAYMILKEKKDMFKQLFSKVKWDVIDLFFIHYLKDYKKGVFKGDPLCLQAQGYSFLDKKMSKENIIGIKKI